MLFLSNFDLIIEIIEISFLLFSNSLFQVDLVFFILLFQHDSDLLLGKLPFLSQKLAQVLLRLGF